MANDTVKAGYVIGSDGKIYVQLPAENRWGFVICDDEQSWDGGVNSGLNSWVLVAEDDKRVTEGDKSRLSCVLENWIEENVPAVEVCSNIEWVRENDFWHRDDIDESDMDDAVRTYQQSIYNDLTDKGWDVAWAKNQRMLYHGWNGAHFTTKCSVVGSYEKLTDEQVAVIDQVREKAAELVKQTWVKNNMFFEFKTDSESGKIKADSYEDACEKLRDMVGDDHEATGAWGWVEDQDGNRLVIGEVP